MTPINLESIIPENYQNYRLDKALALLFPEYSRSQHKQWIQQGAVSINTNVQMQPRHLVNENDQITITAELTAKEDWTAQAIDLNIVYEDDHLMVINKPVGLVVHPGAGNPDNTLVNALLHYNSELATVPRAGIVHRLDKNTSGLLLVAKDLECHHKLVQALQQREITRQYEAIVMGVMLSGGTVNQPIGRHPRNRIKMAVTHNGKPASTHYRVIKRYRAHSHITLKLETGRTHQIRVHMAHIKYPIVGDTTYAVQRIPFKLSADLKTQLHNFKHQALHAKMLSLKHPITQETLTIECPLPADMQQLINTLEEDLACDNT